MRGSSDARPNKHKAKPKPNTRLQPKPYERPKNATNLATKANAEDERELEELDARESELKIERSNHDRLNDEASSQLDKTRKTLDEAVAARTRTRQMAVDAERQARFERKKRLRKPNKRPNAALRSGRK